MLRIPIGLGREGGRGGPGPRNIDATREEIAAEDFELLKAVAYLARVHPHQLLGKISWKTGERFDYADLCNGQALSYDMRRALVDLLEDYLDTERDIWRSCDDASSQIAQFCMIFIAFAALISVLLF